MPQRYTPKQMTNSITPKPDHTWLLTRPVTLDLARRLEGTFYQLNALNEAQKTLQDAADALGINKPTLVNYVDTIGLRWANKRTYAKRNPNRFNA
jgi:hypothetical protein